MPAGVELRHCEMGQGRAVSLSTATINPVVSSVTDWQFAISTETDTLLVDTGCFKLQFHTTVSETKTGIAEDRARNTTPKSGIAYAILAIAVPAPMHIGLYMLMLLLFWSWTLRRCMKIVGLLRRWNV